MPWPDIIPAATMDQVGPVYLVGGSVRDDLLGRHGHDHDFAVQGNAKAMAETVARRLGATLFTIGSGQEANHRVVSGKDIYDFTALVGHSIEEDLKRRDFTINAMAFDLKTQELIDPLGGKEDLFSGRIRLVSHDAILNDPVRMLRAFRFAAIYGFRLVPETFDRIRSECGRIVGVAGERVRSELFKMMAVEDSFPTIKHMVEAGLMTKIVPEMEPTRGCLQNNRHTRDVFDHTMDVYAHLEAVLKDYKKVWPEFKGQIEGYLSTEDHQVLLKFAALFHDLGKPSCRKTDSRGHVTFWRHEAAGVSIGTAICSRLRMSNRHSGVITALIAGHLQPLLLFNARKQGTLTSKGIVRFVRKQREHIVGLLILSLADQRAKAGMGGNMAGEFIDFTGHIFRIYFEKIKPRMDLPRLVTGRDLIRCFNLQPSPVIGKILSALEEAQWRGEIKTKGDAIHAAGQVIARFKRDAVG
jgi:tRNA nucleotidyltransferase/poly(A) polymerase